jgi:hypothetical protein
MGGAVVTRDCSTCGGHGKLGAGGLVGPEEHARNVTCGDCQGTGTELVKCDLCADHEAVREAWVADSASPRKASLLRLCNDCHDGGGDTGHDGVKLAMPPTRMLPSREEDIELMDPKHLQAAMEALRYMPREKVGKA